MQRLKVDLISVPGMQARFCRCVSHCAVLLILALGYAHPAFSSEQAVSFVGEFSNMHHTAEHAYGYSVQLWRSGNEIIGFLLSSNGLAADTPTGQLEKVHFDAGNGSLSFSAKLSVAQVYQGSGEMKPTRDLFTFSGSLQKGKVLAGVLSHKDMLMPDRAPTVERIHLVKTDDSSIIEAKTSSEWKQSADQILKFRGPKW
jgi:hypothetical protein